MAPSPKRSSPKRKTSPMRLNNGVYKFNQTNLSNFQGMYYLTIAITIALMVVFVLLCTNTELTENQPTTNQYQPILGQFESTGTAILLVGIPLALMFACYLYLLAYGTK